MRTLSGFDGLVRNLAAIDFAHDGQFTKAMRFDDTSRPIDALLKRHGEMDDSQHLLCAKAMAGGYQLRRPGPTHEQMLKRIDATEAATNHTLKEARQMLKSLNQKARKNINVGAEVSRAREYVFAAQQRGEIDIKTANEADVRLRNFALNRLQRLQRQ